MGWVANAEIDFIAILFLKTVCLNLTVKVLTELKETQFNRFCFESTFERIYNWEFEVCHDSYRVLYSYTNTCSMRNNSLQNFSVRNLLLILQKGVY